jgi:hypothetical protein
MMCTRIRTARPLSAQDETRAAADHERERVTETVLERTGYFAPELRLLHPDGGLAVSVSVLARPDPTPMSLQAG